jgi:hypothetical protein
VLTRLGAAQFCGGGPRDRVRKPTVAEHASSRDPDSARAHAIGGQRGCAAGQDDYGGVRIQVGGEARAEGCGLGRSALQLQLREAEAGCGVGRSLHAKNGDYPTPMNAWCPHRMVGDAMSRPG